MMILTVVGFHATLAALTSPFARVKSLDCTAKMLDQLKEKCSLKDVSVRIKDLSFFKGEHKHQGVSAQVSLEVFSDIRAIESWQDFKTILILDHLQDPQNFGSALRHALAFHVDLVLFPRHKAASITTSVASASSGCLFKIPLVETTSFIETLKTLKKEGFGLIGTSTKDAQCLSPKVFWPKSALIVGNEGKGSTETVLNLCDTRVHIPISSACQSLNAAVTAALICYERSKELMR